MKVLQSWLRDYIPFRIPPEDLSARLGMLGLETEGLEEPGKVFDGFVVGSVLTRDKHPNADRLSVCRVTIGTEELTVVCGAPNVAPGQKVVVGLVGATVPKSRHTHEGEPFVLGRVKIRGVESSGMICSEDELGLGKDAAGILVLGDDARVGMPLAQYLGLDDVAYDLEITPNRPDWLSHIGVAREIGVLVKKRVRIPPVRVREGKEAIHKHLSITVDDRTNCPRFAARMVRGVRIGPSPRWMQNRLRNAGLRPINNVVDVTNCVMLECGQPMHAFDYRLLKGGRIIVRQAAPGTTFTTLDGKSHILPEGAVMVCDAEREVSVAGVMGGANSEINNETSDIVLEAAYWNPPSIRRTAKALGIVSDASQRFERGADPNVIPFALDRAAQLVMECAGGTILKGVVDIYPRRIREREIALRPERANEILGTSLTRQEVIRFLGLLEIKAVRRRGDAVVFRVPTFRVDLDRDIDLIEEVARVYGYANIEAKTTATVQFGEAAPSRSRVDALRESLIGMGFQEAISYSMQDEAHAALGGSEPVKILNPQNQEMTCLRTSLVPGLLDSVAVNVNRGAQDIRLFETGHVFSIDHTEKAKLVENFLEEERVCMLTTGRSAPRHWTKHERAADIFDLKGQVDALLAKLGLDKRRFISYSTSNGLTDSTLGIEIHGVYAGYLGRVKDGLLRQFDIEQDVFLAEMSIASLTGSHVRKYEPLPKFPRVRRDVAFTVNVETTAEAVEEKIRGSSSELVQSVELFDLYEGDPLPQGKKSLAFSLELMSREKTLTESEIEVAVQDIVKGVAQLPGATLRGIN